MRQRLEYYLRLPYRIEIYPDEGGYTAAIPDLPGCITCADTLDEVLEMIEDAKAGWLELALEDGDTIPEPSVSSAQELSDQLWLPHSLRRRLIEVAIRENMSPVQFVHRTLAKALAH
ncbi:MAG: type II toxin-antitoxin system HicB family antitoxin [Chloroflexi bacterium]|nr:type II toxin-antitoxin system HicB family antitoxin [Chloroflexota bacterium]